MINGKPICIDEILEWPMHWTSECYSLDSTILWLSFPVYGTWIIGVT